MYVCVCIYIFLFASGFGLFSFYLVSFCFLFLLMFSFCLPFSFAFGHFIFSYLLCGFPSLSVSTFLSPSSSFSFSLFPPHSVFVSCVCLPLPSFLALLFSPSCYSFFLSFGYHYYYPPLPSSVPLISDPRRGRYMVLPAFNFFFFFFFPPRFCTDHISGTVTLRDSKLSVLLGPAV